MNCKQVEKLLPLHVAGDLEANKSAIIAAHLTNCAACQTQTELFSASQNWLQNLSAPEFTATQFAQIRTKVFAQIEASEVQKIAHLWFVWQLKFGFAATVLFLVAGITIYMAQQSPLKIVEVVQDSSVLRTPPSLTAAARSTIPRTVATRSTSRTNRKKPAKLIGALAASSPIKPEVIALTEELAVDSAALASELPALQTSNEQPQTETPEMLRIEIQTADPNIRIIWFASKDTIATNTKMDLR